MLSRHLTIIRYIRQIILVLAITAAGTMRDAVAEEAPANYKLPRPGVLEELKLEGRWINIEGTKMYYVEQGQGDPIVFVHGNPTSSYLWRNVIPHVSGQGRAIALDLAGMGRSGKPRSEYRYKDHYNYAEGFIDSLKLTNITFVVHDWGAALGFDYASHHPDRVKRIAFMGGTGSPRSATACFLVHTKYSKSRDGVRGSRFPFHTGRQSGCNRTRHLRLDAA